MQYDLEERTRKFSKAIIKFLLGVKENRVNDNLISQLIRSATSVGANYCEADCAESNKDFIHKMAISNKEAKESKHFLRMVSKACPEYSEEGRILWKEAHELNLIFTTIIKNAKLKLKN